jgi:hypothetical protein
MHLWLQYTKMDSKRKALVGGIFSGSLVAVLLTACISWMITADPPGSCSGFNSNIFPETWEADYSSRKIFVTLINTAETDIQINSVSVGTDDPQSHCFTDLNENLSSRKTYTLNLSNCVFPGPGDYFAIGLNISYTDLTSGKQNTISGRCKGAFSTPSWPLTDL